MYKVLFLFLVASASGVSQKKFVFDLMKSPLTAEEIRLLVSNRDIAPYPMLAEIPAGLKFDCGSQDYPGFYADVTTQCQVFHRCSLFEGMSSFLCTNGTIFNQLTLVCDHWYNVDCDRSNEFATFANSRLYTKQDLFDTPPRDYIAPYQLAAEQRLKWAEQPIAANTSSLMKTTSAPLTSTQEVEPAAVTETPPPFNRILFNRNGKPRRTVL